ncbi:hypothetical protein FACS1894182_08300 [Bacteroidia bacterium]|nr:hypothetical protein FACS1894182_08300 [Bacteroidia bacterium]
MFVEPGFIVVFFQFGEELESGWGEAGKFGGYFCAHQVKLFVIPNKVKYLFGFRKENELSCYSVDFSIILG